MYFNRNLRTTTTLVSTENFGMRRSRFHAHSCIHVTHHPPASAIAVWYASWTSGLSRPFKDIIIVLCARSPRLRDQFLGAGSVQYRVAGGDHECVRDITTTRPDAFTPAFVVELTAQMLRQGKLDHSRRRDLTPHGQQKPIPSRAMSRFSYSHTRLSLRFRSKHYCPCPHAGPITL